jgi:hypothetical protein
VVVVVVRFFLLLQFLLIIPQLEMNSLPLVLPSRKQRCKSEVTLRLISAGCARAAPARAEADLAGAAVAPVVEPVRSPRSMFARISVKARIRRVVDPIVVSLKNK